MATEMPKYSFGSPSDAISLSSSIQAEPLKRNTYAEPVLSSSPYAPITTTLPKMATEVPK
jgi:hypothetical protein